MDYRAASYYSAGAAGRRSRLTDRLPAGDDPVRLARHSGAAGGLSHHDHQNLEPVPVSAEARTCRRRRDATAAVDHRLAAGAEIHPWSPRLFGRWWQIRRAAAGRNEEMALGGVGLLPGGATQSRVPAVFRAAQRRVLTECHHVGHARDPDAA